MFLAVVSVINKMFLTKTHQQKKHHVYNSQLNDRDVKLGRMVDDKNNGAHSFLKILFLIVNIRKQKKAEG